MNSVSLFFSTSNLTPQTSAEATWTDYFPLQGTKSSIDGNDFGFILQNFILEVCFINEMSVTMYRVQLSVAVLDSWFRSLVPVLVYVCICL